MKDKNHHFKEETVHKILELAARYYTEQTNREPIQGYTIEELKLFKSNKLSSKPLLFCSNKYKNDWLTTAVLQAKRYI